MSHAYHPNLDDYDPANVLHDGCDECEGRATSIAGLLELDDVNLRRLWDRMMWREFPFTREGRPLGPYSDADFNATKMLYHIGVLLERTTTLSPFKEGMPWLPTPASE